MLLVTPKFVYLYTYSSTKNIFLDVLSKLNCLDNLILESLDFFLLLSDFRVQGVFEIKISSKE